MSRCLCRALCGALFLCLGASSPVFASNLSGWTPTSDSSPSLETIPAGSTFDQHRFELGGTTVNGAIDFGEEPPSPLFTSPSVADDGNTTGVNVGKENGADAAGSEWDYLWRNASRIPITSIPEPTTASLLIGGCLLLWARRTRKPAQ